MRNTQILVVKETPAHGEENDAMTNQTLQDSAGRKRRIDLSFCCMRKDCSPASDAIMAAKDSRSNSSRPEK